MWSTARQADAGGAGGGLLARVPGLLSLGFDSARGVDHEGRWGERLRHVGLRGGWKKLEPMWDLIIRAKRASAMLPVLETTLAAFGTRSSRKAAREQRNTEFVGPALSAEAKQVSPEMAGVIAHTPTNRLPVIQKTSTQEEQRSQRDNSNVSR